MSFKEIPIPQDDDAAARHRHRLDETVPGVDIQMSTMILPHAEEAESQMIDKGNTTWRSRSRKPSSKPRRSTAASSGAAMMEWRMQASYLETFPAELMLGGSSCTFDGAGRRDATGQRAVPAPWHRRSAPFSPRKAFNFRPSCAVSVVAIAPRSDRAPACFLGIFDAQDSCLVPHRSGHAPDRP